MGWGDRGVTQAARQRDDAPRLTTTTTMHAAIGFARRWLLTEHARPSSCQRGQGIEAAKGP